ncbi:hypothetical protein EVAR_90610_1 [Eumeta japonica]|uniref:Uncharacterized protein n=1 Tax=Eumeta variegata TaxID=151549 RepID=A0A4C1YSH9_EUMVA|nr:hypothetical protein EVAR_90610_1 [Eumeta japonica]
MVMSQTHKILHEDLEVRKVCTPRIPHNLTKAQKPRCINWCHEIMQRFGGSGSNAVYDMVKVTKTLRIRDDGATHTQQPRRTGARKAIRSKYTHKSLVCYRH